MSTFVPLRVIACEALIGEEVVDARGEPLGRVAHIVIDASRGRIAYAVLACGGVFGIGETLHAIPWGALAFDAGFDAFILDGRDRPDASRAFDHDRWPPMEDPAWARGVHDAYRAAPYWEESRP